MLESRYNVVLNKGGQQIGEREKPEMFDALFFVCFSLHKEG